MLPSKLYGYGGKTLELTWWALNLFYLSLIKLCVHSQICIHAI